MIMFLFLLSSLLVQKKTKTINLISSKVNKQIFFDVVDKIQDEETQRNYLKILKNLILNEDSNKIQIKPTQYSMDEIYNRFKKTQRPITIKDLEEEIKTQINQLKLENYFYRLIFVIVMICFTYL